MASERKAGRFISVDEKCVNVNGEQYWVYSALAVDRNELLSMRVYPTRNSLTTESFIRGVLKYCEDKPEFIVDNAPWLGDALTELGLAHIRQTLGARSPIESASSYLNRERNILQQNNSQPETQHGFKMERGSGMLEPILQNIHLLQPLGR